MLEHLPGEPPRRVVSSLALALIALPLLHCSESHPAPADEGSPRDAGGPEDAAPPVDASDDAGPRDGGSPADASEDDGVRDGAVEGCGNVCFRWLDPGTRVSFPAPDTSLCNHGLDPGSCPADTACGGPSTYLSRVESSFPYCEGMADEYEWRVDLAQPPGVPVTLAFTMNGHRWPSAGVGLNAGRLVFAPRDGGRLVIAEMPTGEPARVTTTLAQGVWDVHFVNSSWDFDGAEYPEPSRRGELTVLGAGEDTVPFERGVLTVELEVNGERAPGGLSHSWLGISLTGAAGEMGGAYYREYSTEDASRYTVALWPDSYSIAVRSSQPRAYPTRFPIGDYVRPGPVRIEAGDFSATTFDVPAHRLELMGWGDLGLEEATLVLHDGEREWLVGVSGGAWAINVIPGTFTVDLVSDTRGYVEDTAVPVGAWRVADALESPGTATLDPAWVEQEVTITIDGEIPPEGARGSLEFASVVRGGRKITLPEHGPATVSVALAPGAYRIGTTGADGVPRLTRPGDFVAGASPLLWDIATTAVTVAIETPGRGVPAASFQDALVSFRPVDAEGRARSFGERGRFDPDSRHVTRRLPPGRWLVVLSSFDPILGLGEIELGVLDVGSDPVERSFAVDVAAVDVELAFGGVALPDSTCASRGTLTVGGRRSVPIPGSGPARARLMLLRGEVDYLRVDVDEACVPAGVPRSAYLFRRMRLGAPPG